jgi:UDPglucose 6-dehydrogenase
MKDDNVRLGFVGAGFVGGAMIRAFAQYNPMEVYDKGKGIGSLKGVAEFADVIFVAVPTPMRQDGTCDTRIVLEVVEEVDQAVQVAGREDEAVEVVIRSTVPPAFLTELWELTKAIEVLYMPEFLTERTADLDFINAPRYIIGTQNTNDPDQYPKTIQVFEQRFPRTRVVVMSYAEAALVKYGTNNFFTVKLSYFNEIYATAVAYGADPDVVIEEILQDGRIGRSHYQVPGHDGDLGWGGHCFPKDNRAFAHIAGHDNIMVNAAWEVNELKRSKRDWEDQVGRTVSED